MAIVVESSSSAGFTLATSITIPKPTGLAVGDLMVCYVGLINGTSVANFSTLSGWTEKSDYTGGSGTTNVIGCQVKIADAGDVAASNFTFTANASGRIGGVILRISGHAPNAYSATTTNALSSATSTPSGTVSLTPLYDDSLIILGFLGGAADGTGSISGYTINGTNPIFTEYLDITVDAGANDGIFGVAAGVQETASEITTISATSTQSKNWKTQVTAVYPFTNASGTASLLTTTPTFFSEASVNVGTNGTTNLLQATPEIFSQAGVGTQPTQWNEPSESTSTWTLIDK